MFGDVFRGRRVFVTGHTGFKGSWLTLWLLDLGAEVTGYALEPPTTPNLFEAIGLARAGEGRFADRRGDVRDAEELNRALSESMPEIVFHLAAQPLVRRSYAEPQLTYETNVMGVVNLLEAVRGLAASGRAPRVVVNVTTDKCYENVETDRAYVEGDPLGGFDPYSSSKACSELVTAAYRRSFFAAPDAPSVASARAGNVLGGGDWGEERLLPDCVRALLASETIVVRSPDSVRPWQHVLEPLSGYLALAARLWEAPRVAPDEGQAAGAWNFGPDPANVMTAGELVDAVVREWGAGEWRRAADTAEQPHEAGLLLLDASKADRELGWRPAWSVDEAVAATVGWYREWAGGADLARLATLCRSDIARYSEAAASAGAAWCAAVDARPAGRGGEL